MIPEELRTLPQWVAWRTEERDGKPTKVPYDPKQPTRKASSTGPATWGTHRQALAVLDADGIGFVFDRFYGGDVMIELVWFCEQAIQETGRFLESLRQLVEQDEESFVSRDEAHGVSSGEPRPRPRVCRGVGSLRSRDKHSNPVFVRAKAIPNKIGTSGLRGLRKAERSCGLAPNRGARPPAEPLEAGPIHRRPVVGVAHQRSCRITRKEIQPASLGCASFVGELVHLPVNAFRVDELARWRHSTPPLESSAGKCTARAGTVNFRRPAPRRNPLRNRRDDRYSRPLQNRDEAVVAILHSVRETQDL